jgi:hypothetical protein
MVILKSDQDTCCCKYRFHLYSFILFKNEWMLFYVYMDCCSLSVTGPQTSTRQAILIKRYSKHYRHNVKSPYECFMDQNGVHGYWNNKVFYYHWPSTSDIKTLVCSKYLRKIYSVYHHCLILIGLVSTVILKKESIDRMTHKY